MMCRHGDPGASGEGGACARLASVDVCEEAALALVSEQLLFDGNCGALSARVPAKVLLARPTAESEHARTRLRLSAATSEQDWRDYEAQRLVVEAEFGVAETQARTMIDALRDRGARLGLELYLARDGKNLVGAIGRFRLPAHPWCARLQEVDVFPRWRGQGYGDALLAAVLDLLASEGTRTAVVGADEDAWPLGWYRKRGFYDVARVPLTR
jgi:ribosomal protein S18 acetylase RimI-like enzyme